MHRDGLFLKNTHKGTALFTSESINPGNFVAVYTGKWTSKVTKGNIYSVGYKDYSLTPIIRKKENHMAAMANEPSPNESINCKLLEYEFQGHEINKENGTYVALILFAIKHIEANSEILWFYGDNYKRSYNIGNTDWNKSIHCENPLKYITSNIPVLRIT